jgi:ssDNA-binding Zn-finger/Zn-ribbon topoisomerase 1
MLKENKCPKCGEMIDHLIEERSQKHLFRFDSEGSYQFLDTGDILSSVYECPECDAILFEDDEGAQDFFKEDFEKNLSNPSLKKT